MRIIERSSDPRPSTEIGRIGARRVSGSAMSSKGAHAQDSL